MANGYTAIMDNAISNVKSMLSTANEDYARARSVLKLRASAEAYDEQGVLNAVRSVRYAKERCDELYILVNNLESVRDKMLILEREEQNAEKKVVIFLHDGIIEGGFTTDPSIAVTVSDFDRDMDDKDAEEEFWRECKHGGMINFNPIIYHPSNNDTE